jgi:hypothetical protein
MMITEIHSNDARRTSYEIEGVLVAEVIRRGSNTATVKLFLSDEDFDPIRNLTYEDADRLALIHAEAF